MLTFLLHALCIRHTMFTHSSEPHSFLQLDPSCKPNVYARYRAESNSDFQSVLTDPGNFIVKSRRTRYESNLISMNLFLARPCYKLVTPKDD